MLVENGLVRATASDGSQWSFTPSLSNIAELDTPAGIVDLYIALHGPRAEQEARYVLAVLCDQEDTSDLIGWRDDKMADHPGLMPPAEQIILARHLMQHGIVGIAKPEKAGSGKYAKEFNASEYIAAACVHLGLSRADAEDLSMTEFQTMFAMKFPDSAKKERDIPTRDEYKAALMAIDKARGKRNV